MKTMQLTIGGCSWRIEGKGRGWVKVSIGEKVIEL